MNNGGGSVNHLEFIKNRVHQHKGAAEIYRELVETYGSARSPSRTTVYLWTSRFRGGYSKEIGPGVCDNGTYFNDSMYHGGGAGTTPGGGGLPPMINRSRSRFEFLRQTRDYVRSRSMVESRPIVIFREMQHIYGARAPSYAAVKMWSRKAKAEASQNDITTTSEATTTMNGMMGENGQYQQFSHYGGGSKKINQMLAENEQQNESLLDNDGGGGGVGEGEGGDILENDDQDIQCVEYDPYGNELDTSGNNTNTNLTSTDTTPLKSNQNGTVGGEMGYRPTVRLMIRKSAPAIHNGEVATTSYNSVMNGTAGGENSGGKLIFVHYENGFDRGLEPERICENVIVNGERMYVIEWKNSNKKDLGKFGEEGVVLFCLLFERGWRGQTKKGLG